MTSLPHRAKDFATHILFPGRLVRHHAMGGRHDSDTKSVVNRPDLFGADVIAPAWLADPFDVDDRMLLGARVLQVDAQKSLFVVADELVVSDIAGFFENFSDLRFDLGPGNVDAVVFRLPSIPDAG
ncbi:hypothetical protein DESC_610147 [Desulfosarcina cetonica]|nr:hypothetical protein DESC_610147 [Desulfosarcina cetonica]